MYSDRMGTDKSKPQTKSSRQKTPDKTPGQKLPQTIETEFVPGAFVQVFCTRPSKNRGGEAEMCDAL